ncbi:PcfJ domain-containing protein [Alteromonas sp. 14N.309.X.WAT.G.H12]|uniref:PcfJ domain-containing protein n=1 Tax=Alteromonas sp. 14N.309.X.WAT.G.H12 TaxID=3120824 RepID=UPI002FD009B4
MLTFMEKYAHLLPKDVKEGEDVLRAELGLVLDASMPQTLPIVIDDVAEGVAVYAPTGIEKNEGVYQSTGVVTLFLRRHQDNVFIQVKLDRERSFPFNGPESLKYIAKNIKSVLTKNQYAHPVCSGADIASWSCPSEWYGKSVFTNQYAKLRTNSTGQPFLLESLQSEPHLAELYINSSSLPTDVFNSTIFARVGLENLLKSNLGVDSNPLFDAAEQEFKNVFEQAYQSTVRPRNTFILQSCPEIMSNEELESNYDILDLNFIGSAPSPLSALYRKQFVDSLTNMLSLDDASKHGKIRLLEDIATMSRTSRWREHQAVNMSMFTAVDKGESFLPHLARGAGTPNASKKEVRRALAIMRSHQAGGTDRWRIELERKHTAFGLAKLPKSWFDIPIVGDPDGKKEDYLTSSLAPSPQGGNQGAYRLFLNRATQLGLELDRLKGVGNKQGMKALIKPWAFANQSSSFYATLEQLESKYKIEAEGEDYTILLEQLSKCVELGMLYRDTSTGNDCVEYTSEGTLAINPDAVSSSIKAKIEEQCEDSCLDWIYDDDVKPLFEGEVQFVYQGETYTFTSVNDKSDVDFAFSERLKRGEATALLVQDESGFEQHVILAIDDEGVYVEESADLHCVAEAFAAKVNKGGIPEVDSASIERVTEQREQAVERYDDNDYDIYEEMDQARIERTLNSSSVEPSLLARLNGNQALHKQYNSLIQDGNLASSYNFKWESLFDEEVILTSPEGKQYRLSSVNTRLDLLEEGVTMNHCVFSYLGKCLSGESAILSLKDANNNRVVTVELEFLEFDDDMCEIGQCYGYSNEKPSRDVLTLVEKFVSDINQKQNPYVSYDDIERVTSQYGNEAVFDHVESLPLDNGSICTSIPYDTPSVYIAAFAIDAFTPKGLSVETLFSDNTLSYELYIGSGIGEGMEKIRSIAAALDMDPLNAARIMVINDLTPDSPDLNSCIERTLMITKRTKELHDSLQGQVPEHQVATLINEELEDAFGVALSEGVNDGKMDALSISRSLRAKRKEDGRALETPNDTLRQMRVSSPQRANSLR